MGPKMPDNRITCLACGVFRMEMEALIARGSLDYPVTTLDSMLHMKPAGLERAMERAMAAGPGDRFLLVYGDCHPRMHEMQDRKNTAKVAGINCCDIVLGRDVYRKLQKELAFIFMPEWTMRWREIFTHELGFKKPDVLQAFIQEHRKKLVYVDTGVLPVPDKTIQDIREFFGMPVEVMPVSLDFLLQGVNKALQKFMRRDPDDK